MEELIQEGIQGEKRQRESFIICYEWKKPGNFKYEWLELEKFKHNKKHFKSKYECKKPRHFKLEYPKLEKSKDKKKYFKSKDKKSLMST